MRSLVAYNKLSVKLAGTYGGFSDSYDGASHQSVEDVAVMRAIPNMTVIVPADEFQTKQAVFAAAAYEGPVFLRLSRAEVPPVYDASYKFVIGKGTCLKAGSDVTIIANGYMVTKALEAAEILALEGIKAEIIDMATVKPIDAELILKSAKKTGAVVTVEEHNIYGGLGSAVAEVLGGALPLPLEIVGIGDVFGESGAYEAILTKHGLDKTAVAAACQKSDCPQEIGTLVPSFIAGLSGQIPAGLFFTLTNNYINGKIFQVIACYLAKNSDNIFIGSVQALARPKLERKDKMGKMSRIAILGLALLLAFCPSRRCC